MEGSIIVNLQYVKHFFIKFYEGSPKIPNNYLNMFIEKKMLYQAVHLGDAKDNVLKIILSLRASNISSKGEGDCVMMCFKYSREYESSCVLDHPNFQQNKTKSPVKKVPYIS